jgi:tRNA nucleotidyltransferase/poly(A) polymerase
MIEICVIIQTLVFTITLFVLINENKQLRKTISASNYGKMIDMLKELRILRIKDPELAQVYQNEIKGLSPTDIKYHFFNLIVSSILEMLYFDMKHDLISKETWQFWLQKIKDISHEESFRNMVKRESYQIVNP